MSNLDTLEIAATHSQVTACAADCGFCLLSLHKLTILHSYLRTWDSEAAYASRDPTLDESMAVTEERPQLVK